MRENKCNVSLTLQAVIKISHWLQLKLLKAGITVRTEKSVFDGWHDQSAEFAQRYVRKAALAEFISSWQQRSVAGTCTDLPFSKTLPRWRDGSKKSFQTLTALNNNIIVARRKTTDAETVEVEG